MLLVGFALQFSLDGLPCPLCLLQRVAFAMVAFGFLLNVRFGSEPAHYGIILLSALFGAAVSARQVLLHIVPGSGAYGSPILGLHFYSWAFVLFCATILATAVLLLLHAGLPDAPRRGTRGRWVSLVAVAAIAVTAANAVTTFVECGPIECPENPVSYWLLSR